VVVGRNVTGRVTLLLKDVDVWDAFEIILLSNELAYDQKGAIYQIMSQRDYELLYGERYKDKKQMKMVKLKYAKAVDLSRALNQIKTNVGRIVVDDASNSLTLIDLPSKIKDMEQFITQTDLPLTTRVFSLNYAQAEKLSTKIQEVLTKGVGTVRIDERTNKLAVTDYPEKIDEIAKIIAAFDEKTGQVVIDAQIIEVSPSEAYSMGIDWDYWLKKNVHLFSSLPAPLPTGVGSIANRLAFGIAAKDIAAKPASTGEYKTILDFIKVIGNTKILSSPRIMVMNNQEAKILVGTKEAYITSTTSSSGGATVTSQSVNFVDVGIKLYVTPTVNKDGFVIMKIKPEVSSSKPSLLKSEGQDTQVPIVTTSETETTIMVKDGATIMIAGLKKDKDSKNESKIPGLGDIPVVGNAFKNRQKESAKSELVIFITPHIVSGEESVEYASNTSDSDVVRIQALSKAEQKLPQRKKIENEIEYQDFVIEKITETSKAEKAAQESLVGQVEVRFILTNKGMLKGEPRVIKSTNDALDRRAIGCIKKSAPFPAFPATLAKEEEVFKIGLAYE